jgi:hypothetical protein
MRPMLYIGAAGPKRYDEYCDPDPGKLGIGRAET